jgi:hypothetical protein
VNVFGGVVSFLGFLAILLLRCSPLAMVVPQWSSRFEMASMVRHKTERIRRWRHETFSVDTGLGICSQ